MVGDNILVVLDKVSRQGVKFLVKYLQENKTIPVTAVATGGVTIGDDIRIFHLGLRGGEVQLGIKAPRDVLILRTELMNRDPASIKKLPPPGVAHKEIEGHASTQVDSEESPGLGRAARD